MLDRRAFLRFLGLTAGAATGAALFPAPQEVPCTVTIDIEALPAYPRAIFGLNQRSSYGWTSINQELSFIERRQGESRADFEVRRGTFVELPPYAHGVMIE